MLIAGWSAGVVTASGVTHIVAADGSGDFSTIAEAVAAAADGDTILVKPGTYAGSLVIDKDITLRGDGPREDITIDLPGVALVDPPDAVQPTLLLDSGATVSGLTILGARRQGGIVVSGGAPTLEGNAIGTVVQVAGPAQAVIRANTFLDFADVIVSGGATSRIEANHFVGGSIRIDGGRDVTLQGNVIEAPVRVVGEPGIDVRGPGATAIIQGNAVSGSGIGISVADGASAIVEGNELRDTGIGIAWFAWQPGTIVGNSVCRSPVAVWIAEGATPDVDANADC